ncbi:MAG: MaoC/PaaZ C-terminal domain-containing protein [Desulfobacterales bacterium]|jgi:3-hydroxymyristoyl/3-hydroxydecanoyl-(acyl carrier protein) dehydratase|nr:MaoC/PaaZ C-terminal domain-containing protein [Desulfobacterales bacterium]
MWYEVTIQNPSPESDLCADVHVPVASPWFQGHFPGNPVLPGIAQLGLVFDVIRQALKADLRVTQVSRVRFKQMVLPDDRLTVRVLPKVGRSGQYAFRILKQEELVCIGDITVEPFNRITD